MQFAMSHGGATISPMGYTYYLDDGGDSRLEGKGNLDGVGAKRLPSQPKLASSPPKFPPLPPPACIRSARLGRC